ncbi:hypothetical protein HYALB_00001538 [Hymenoscyphus albidus]|uniref:Uncharacterized protein n=1 Tax=Hymenoscyphus albidus TaxID=595503 RepID=A0A9N9PQ02_9HELO|nr:hypothetical protein HYALB_00001538 [Hymenoscyphus albidus]
MPAERPAPLKTNDSESEYFSSDEDTEPEPLETAIKLQIENFELQREVDAKKTADRDEDNMHAIARMKRKKLERQLKPMRISWDECMKFLRKNVLNILGIIVAAVGIWFRGQQAWAAIKTWLNDKEGKDKAKG